MGIKKEIYHTDIFNHFAIWLWGREIPVSIFACAHFIKKSPLGKYILKLERENRKIRKNKKGG